MSDIQKKAREVIEIMSGAPGPFLEDEDSYFGMKRTDPSMKDAYMETDLGGCIITKSKTTYGEADRIAAKVDLVRFPFFAAAIKETCYWHKPVQGKWHYYGEWYYAVYQYLRQEQYLIEYDPVYSNSVEYLLNLVCNRLIEEGYLDIDTTCKYMALNKSRRKTS